MKLTNNTPPGQHKPYTYQNWEQTPTLDMAKHHVKNSYKTM